MYYMNTSYMYDYTKMHIFLQIIHNKYKNLRLYFVHHHHCRSTVPPTDCFSIYPSLPQNHTHHLIIPWFPSRSRWAWILDKPLFGYTRGFLLWIAHVCNHVLVTLCASVYLCFFRLVRWSEVRREPWNMRLQHTYFRAWEQYCDCPST